MRELSLEELSVVAGGYETEPPSDDQNSFHENWRCDPYPNSDGEFQRCVGTRSRQVYVVPVSDGPTPEEIAEAEYIAEFDQNGDGYVDFYESPAY